MFLRLANLKKILCLIIFLQKGISNAKKCTQRKWNEKKDKKHVILPRGRYTPFTFFFILINSTAVVVQWLFPAWLLSEFCFVSYSKDEKLREFVCGALFLFDLQTREATGVLRKLKLILTTTQKNRSLIIVFTCSKKKPFMSFDSSTPFFWYS